LPLKRKQTFPTGSSKFHSKVLILLVRSGELLLFYIYIKERLTRFAR
jgi:hypothetical protein